MSPIVLLLVFHSRLFFFWFRVWHSLLPDLNTHTLFLFSRSCCGTFVYDTLLSLTGCCDAQTYSIHRKDGSAAQCYLISVCVKSFSDVFRHEGTGDCLESDAFSQTGKFPECTVASGVWKFTRRLAGRVSENVPRNICLRKFSPRSFSVYSKVCNRVI